MNAKKAKALRKVVNNLIKFNKEYGDISIENIYIENIKNRKTDTTYDMENDVIVPKVRVISSGTIKLDKKCKRSIYKKLKSSLKNIS